VCVECLIGKQKKPILVKVTEPSSVPYRAPSAWAKMAAYPDTPPVIPVDDPFIVLTETKFSIRYIPVWARYSPLRTRVEHMLSP